MGEAEIQVDDKYKDVELARLYDAECPWHRQDDFYLSLDLQAASVLDVGCGTGTRLARARDVGHKGVLVGVDPGPGMLEVARAKTDRVEWILGSAQTLDLGRRFELITMTGNAFQVLLDDAAVRAALRTFRRHLTDGGLLAFETRNPQAREWRRWVADGQPDRVVTSEGKAYDVWADHPVEHDTDLVTFQSFVRPVDTGEERSTSSTLRFIDPRHLRDLLEEAGFQIEGWFGDWDRGEVQPASLEIIVLARAPRGG